MSEISNLEPRAVWEIFDMICSIPHISGHEAALAEKLAEKASACGLDVCRDSAGNVIIHRPASIGFEGASRIILQAHMDMVPASTGDFDFINTAITPYIDGRRVRARNTSLGADDGIGVANIMALMLDKGFKCGALTAIFTVCEETGMSGARELAAEHLNGKYLLNLDSDAAGFCTGCAGGRQQDFTFRGDWQDTVSGNALKITLSGLAGGHSGCCIHEDRGNALRFLAEFLDQLPGCHAASFHGGSVSNAIPCYAEAVVVCQDDISAVQKMADAFTVLLKKECPRASGMDLSVAAAAMPAKVWSKKMQTEVLSALSLVPDGVIRSNEKWNIPQSSSNLASVDMTENGDVLVVTSQRGMSDECRDEVCSIVEDHFKLFNASGSSHSEYPATPIKEGSFLQQIAVECAEKLGRSSKVYAIHGGLESGWFSMKNPELQIISFGAAHDDFHTVNEWLEISSVAETDKLLRDLIQRLNSADAD